MLPNEDFSCDDFKDINDYQKVIHAKWKKDYYYYTFGDSEVVYECSICHHEVNYKTKYCSNCGAKMDLE